MWKSSPSSPPTKGPSSSSGSSPPPPDGGLWTGPKLAAYAAERYAVVVAKQTGWVWMRQLGLTPQVPRPKNRGRPPRRSSGSGKDALARRLDELRRADPGRPVELWAEDEVRLGLKPIVRRVWSPRGQRPTANGRARYEWLYLYAFVHPASGRNLELIIRRLNTALEEFAAWANPDRGKTIVPLVDNAGWHVAKGLVLLAGLVLHHLPPCTLELQPTEPLWPLARESMANKGFDGLDEMEAVLVDRCHWLIHHPEAVRGPVDFGWVVAMNG